MKKLVKSILFLFLLMNLALTIQMGVVNAAETGASPGAGGAPSSGADACAGENSYLNIRCKMSTLKDNYDLKLPNFDIQQHPDAPADYVNDGTGALVSPIYYALDFFRYALSGIAVIIMIIASVTLVTESTDEEAKNAKMTLLWGVVGLLLVNLAPTIVKKIFFGEYGEAFEDATEAQLFAEEGTRQIRSIIGFANAFVASGAIFTIVIRGVAVILSAGEEEALTKAKTHIIYAIVGLLAAGLSELVVRGVIFPDAGESMPDTEQARSVIAMIINYISGFIALFAFVTLFYAGYLYVIAAGNEEQTGKVRKIFIGTVIALLTAMGAFALVNTLTVFEKPVDTAEVTEQDRLPESK
jgi:hypothetical protein